MYLSDFFCRQKSQFHTNYFRAEKYRKYRYYRYFFFDIDIFSISQQPTSLKDPDGLTKGRVFNCDICAMGIQHQQSGSVVMIWGGMIANKPGLKLSADKYCSFSKNSINWAIAR